jgi:hypothetical protein
VVRVSAEPAPRRIFTSLCPMQSPAFPALVRPYPSGDWAFNFQTSAHEHNRPGGVFQSFCPSQSGRHRRVPFSYIGPVRSFWGCTEGAGYLWEDVMFDCHVPGAQAIIVIQYRHSGWEVMYFGYHPFFVCLPPPRAFAIFSLHRTLWFQLVLGS